MVNPAICIKCDHCNGVDLPIREDDGSLVAEAMVHCGLEGGWDLIVSSFVPKGCPYDLEHLLLKEETESLQEGWDDERQGCGIERETGNDSGV